MGMDALNFWQMLSSQEPGICWLWLGARDPRGYGRVRWQGKARLAHRVAYELTHGQAADCVCHRCDTPPCCNPEHLFDGTRADNNRDMTAKGRHGAVVSPGYTLRGEEHQRAKLTQAIAERIRAVYVLGGVTQRALARKHGVSQRTVAKLLNRVSYVVDSEAEKVRLGISD